MMLHPVGNSGTILLLGTPQFINKTGGHFHQKKKRRKKSSVTSRLQWSGGGLWEAPHGGALF
jgi:hypothetical protein